MDLTLKLYVAFAVLCVIMFIAKIVIPLLLKKQSSTGEQPLPEGFRCFQFHSVAIFLMAMGANWFYGPHLMELYENYGFTTRSKSILLSIGFITAALSGLFVGNFADAIGRKKACILYAICYGINVACHHFNNEYIIGIGRAFAGVATALLYCVFESWMIAAHNARGFPGNLLGSTFNLSWGLNYPVAIVVALICSATSKLPQGCVGDFDASAVVLVIMSIVISLYWDENYGEKSSSIKENYLNGFRAFRASWNVKMLSVIQTFFEGSMFIWIRFWWDILHEAYGAKFDASAVFSLFMINCMVGVETLRLLKLILSKQVISILNCAVASISLLLAAMRWSPVEPFYWKLILFCVYEICVGIYFNIMTDLRGELINDSVRATVTALCRVPLNVIVVALLVSDFHWRVQFFCLAGFNSVAMIAAALIRQQPCDNVSKGNLAFV